MMIKMTVEGIGIDPQNNTLVLLRDEEHKVFVPIYIGPAEAMSIQMELDQREAPRPMTHDLIANILRELDIRLVKVTVNDVDKRPPIFYATLHLQGASDAQTQEVDARPSDAIALALRAQCGIWVSDKVVDQSGIQVEEVVGEEGVEEAPEEETPLPLRSERRRSDIAASAGEKEESGKDVDADKFARLLEGVDLSSAPPRESSREDGEPQP